MFASLVEASLESLNEEQRRAATHRSGPLLMLATGRPELLERRPAWSRHAVLLNALSAAVAAELLDELLGVELPPSVRNVVVERAEGNPLRWSATRTRSARRTGLATARRSSSATMTPQRSPTSGC